MFTVTFPVDTGIFVKTKDGSIGTIACYQCVVKNDVDNDFIVMISGYKQAWGKECLLSELEILGDDYDKVINKN